MAYHRAGIVARTWRDPSIPDEECHPTPPNPTPWPDRRLTSGRIVGTRNPPRQPTTLVRLGNLGRIYVFSVKIRNDFR